MKMVLSRVAGLAIALCVAGAIPVAAKEKPTRSTLSLPATGTFAGGGTFVGTVTINRFERQGNSVVAVGLVSGVLSRASGPLGTALAGEVSWPVAVLAGGISLSGNAEPATAHVSHIVWTNGVERGYRIIPAQAACSVLQIALGPVDVNLLGVQVSLSPVALGLTGESGTPLGDLVCAVSDLLGNVAGLVNVLNNLLGLVTGLLGGLTGG
jgi:hypothetical protein